MSDKLTVEYINERAKQPELFIDECERAFDDKINSIAKYAKKHDIKFIFLSGPTSSGKTTFTKKMAEFFGGDVLRISLDDYYKETDAIPKNKDGSYNFETIYSINTKRFCGDIKKLISGEKISLPRLDFITGVRSDDKVKVGIENKSGVIIEGLHALNPKIYNACCKEKSLKIFISPMSKVFDGERLISNYDIRFIRRMVRDNFFRNAGADITMKMWKSVRAGEKIYMKKYKENADFLIDTFIPYEICAMRDIAIAQLEGIEKTPKSSRLLKNLEKFEDIDRKLIPSTSILNEFLKL